MLIRCETFRSRYFEPGEAPSLATVRNWIRNGTLKGKIINTGRREQFWVDGAAWENSTVQSNSGLPQ